MTGNELRMLRHWYAGIADWLDVGTVVENNGVSTPFAARIPLYISVKRRASTLWNVNKYHSAVIALSGTAPCWGSGKRRSPHPDVVQGV